MKSNARVEGYGAISLKLEKMGQMSSKGVHSIDVGIVKTARYQAEEGQGEPPTVAQVAFWNEYGTKGGGWGGPIPPRPFMKYAIEYSKKDHRISQTMKKAFAKSPYFDKPTAMKIAEIIKSNIDKALFDPRHPRNAPITILMKGSSQPLIDTSLLRRSISYRVNEKAPNDNDVHIVKP